MPLHQEPGSRPKVVLVKSNEVKEENFEKDDSRNVKVRYLVDERQASNRFSLRLYTVGQGGHTPLDRHEYEHQVYILSGEAVLRSDGDEGEVLQRLKAGDVVFVPSNALHQFANDSRNPLVFLCVKGDPRLYSKPAREASGSRDPSQNACAC